MKKRPSIYKKMNIILVVVLLLSLIFSTLSYSKCYVYSATGKKVVLNVQVIKGYDCFTGKFTPPKKLPANFDPGSGSKYGLFNFGVFSKMYLVLVGLAFLNLFFLLMRKPIIASISLSFAFLTAMACLIYFDGFHNYYADSVGERFLFSKTSDTDFGLLSSFGFWLLFVLLLLFNWTASFTSRKKKLNHNLLDN